MASWYVDSAASGTFDGTSWANACSCLQQLTGIQAGGSWSAGATSITMSKAHGGWVTAGMAVYDATNGSAVGTVSSYAGTTLVLTAGALAAGTTSSQLQFGGPQGDPANGDNVFVRNTSAESYNVTTNIFFRNGARNLPICLYSVTNAHTPPVAADQTPGASVTANNGVALTLGGLKNPGLLYSFGLDFKLGAGSSTATAIAFSGTNFDVVHDTCTFDASAATGAISTPLRVGTIGRTIIKNGSWILGGNAAHNVNLGGGAFAYVYGCTLSLAGASIQPNTLINASSQGDFYLEGCDLSAAKASGILSNGMTRACLFRDCDLPTGFAAPSPLFDAARFQFVRCTNNVGSVTNFGADLEVWDYQATQACDTGVTRVGGAQDFNGNAYSHKIVPTANCNVAFPYVSAPLAQVYKGAAGSKTATVYGVVAGGVLPNDNDIWLEVEYPQDASDSLGGITVEAYSALKNPLYVGLPVASDSSTWNGGLSSPTPFLLTKTVPIAQNGPVTVRVLVGKASGGPYYIDPAFTIT